MPAELIGRDLEVTALVAAVRAGRRLSTVLGPPGIGKTRVARAASEHLADETPGAVWFCDLAAASSEETLCLAVREHLEGVGSSALALPAAASPATVDRIGALLESRGPCLLVLDNFEQLSPWSGAVARWLRLAPRASVIVTSRERLAIADEHVIELASLACPAEGDGREAVERSDAVRLFRARSHEAGVPALDDWEAAAEITRRLEGVPLAIELAAARARLMPPHELARRLRTGHAFLAGARSRGGRHETLRAAIGWSWDLLSPEEALALATCSVFAGSFSVAAAEALLQRALAREGGGAASSALEIVAALRDKSLCRLDESGRLSLYASVREFAVERLEERGGAAVDAARGDHLDVFAELAERVLADRLYQGREARPDVVAEARAERDNLVTALRFVMARPDGTTYDRRAVALAAAIALLHAAPADRSAADLSDLLARVDLPAADRAILLLARQSSLGALGRHEETRAIAKELIGMQGVDAGLRAFAHVYAGNQLRLAGDAERAIEEHEQAQLLLEGRERTRLYGMNLACMGRLYCDLRRLPEARDANARSTRICDDFGDRFLAALGIVNLAQLEQEEGSMRRAEELFEDGIERFVVAHEPQYEGIYQSRLGGLYLECGRLDDAQRAFRRAEETLARIHAPSFLVLVHAGWALVHAEAERHDEAAAEIRRARSFSWRGTPGVAGVALELLSGAVELRGPAADPAAIARWKKRHDELADEQAPAARSVMANLDVRFALRMLQRMLARHGGDDDEVVLRLGRELMWFAVDAGARVDLARRGPMRRMLHALADARARRPGETLDREALSSAGWPDERILHEAAATRVRVGVATLRKLGLRDILMTRDDGYLIDPRVRIDREP